MDHSHHTLTQTCLSKGNKPFISDGRSKESNIILEFLKAFSGQLWGSEYVCAFQPVYQIPHMALRARRYQVLLGGRLQDNDFYS
jgi:hypothetical protein